MDGSFSQKKTCPALIGDFRRQRESEGTFDCWAKREKPHAAAVDVQDGRTGVGQMRGGLCGQLATWTWDAVGIWKPTPQITVNALKSMLATGGSGRCDL